MVNLGLKVENIVVKEEIARFEQFLLLSICFQKPSAAEASESVYMRERIKRCLLEIHQNVSAFSEKVNNQCIKPQSYLLQ